MGTPNFANRTLYYGDNLAALRRMNSETVHLIATDPPFKKQRGFFSDAGGYDDRWTWQRDILGLDRKGNAVAENHDDWVDQIQDDWPGAWMVIAAARSTYGDDMGAFLCWLGVRLMKLRRILRNDGSIYVHMDETAVHYDAGLVYWPKRGSAPQQKRYVDENPGTPVTDVIDAIGPLGAHARERTRYPTQKPLALYERIIRASSNRGDVVLDPFCGCATTPVAAERLGRQWVGMDIWEMAYDKVASRLREYGILVDRPELDGAVNENGMMRFNEYRLTLIDNKDKGEEFPARTDDNEVAAPALNLRRPRPTEPWQQLSNALIRRILVAAQGRNGLVGCAGCGRALEADFFHLDQISPKLQGGENYITNRILICGPCNSRKSDTNTLKGLQNDNRRERWMKDRKLAEEMRSLARMRAEWVRDNWDTEQCREFIAGLQ